MGSPAKTQSPMKIAATFAHKSLLVTGASGFLGKVLVEKLLYSIPEIKTIYLLIRPLKGERPEERLAKLLQNPLFNRIRCTNAQLLQKLCPIAGDLMEEGLGLRTEDAQRLCQEVSVVFHCAATVKFDEALRVSIQMNLIGTQQLIALCQKMDNLISVVHTSTAYANCNLAKTEERIYEPEVLPTELIHSTTWMNNEMLNALTPLLLGSRPNTYTFTKALAESQLTKDGVSLPLIIVRPSIIGAAWREPLPGWIDNVNGANGLFAAVGKGVLTNMCGSVESNADIIPVDIVSNTLIAAASYRANLKTNEIPVIHCCSGSLNPLKWNRVAVYVEQFYYKFPLDQCYRVPSTYFHSSRLLFVLNFYAKHYIPAYMLDIGFRLLRKKARYVKLSGKVWRMIETLHYFTTRGWHFESKNIVKLWDSLCEEDQKTYNFDVRLVDWDRYLFDYLMGVKLYLLKEKLENIPKARKNLLWLKQVSLYSNATFWALCVRLFAWRRNRTQKWTLWLAGFMTTYLFQNFSLRPRVYLKSLEEYHKTALPNYA